MKKKQIAAQLYTLREYLTTPDQILSTLKEVRKIGFSAVQVSGMGPISTQELKRMLDGEGLCCCATHEPSEKILSEPERIVERLNELACDYTAYPVLRNVNTSCKHDIVEFAGLLQKAGVVLSKSEKVLTYHNHAIEFQKYGNSTLLEIIYENTDPKYIQAELDTYWIQYGGADPVDWCRRLHNRLPLIHLKDYRITAQGQPTYAEIGQGNLNWKAIFSEAELAGCKWFIIEQDECERSPFESLKISIEFICEHFVEEIK